MAVRIGGISREGAISALVYVLAFLPLASVLHSHFGFPLDDSWIHQVIARNFAETRVLGFTPGTLTSGSTSILWTVVLAINTAFFRWLSPVIYCLLLSIGLFACIGYAMKRLTEEDGFGGAASWSFAIGPALSANFLWFGLIGMEHLLFIALCLFWALVWFRSPPLRTVFERLCLFLLPLMLVLTRPEGLFIVALFLVSIRVTSRSLRDGLNAATGLVCGLAISCFINWRVSGQPMPGTMRGRQFLFTPNPGLRGRLHFLGETAVAITKTWVIRPPQSALHGMGLLINSVAGLLFLLFAYFAVRRLWLVRAKRLISLCVWALLVELLYFAVLPAIGHGGRYVAFPLMMFFSISFFGLQEFVGEISRNRSAVWLILAVSGLTLFGDSMLIWRHVASAGIDQINTEHGAMAVWLDQHLSEDVFQQSQLAAFDIGRIGYQFNGEIVDLGGLVDSRYLPFLLRGDTSTYLKNRGIRYVVLPTDFDGTGFAKTLALDRQHGAILSEVHAVCASPEIASLAMNATKSASPCQRLYSISFIDPR